MRSKILKLSALLLVACGISAFALGPQTNHESITITDSSGGRFDQFLFDIGSYNSQYFSLDFDQSLAGTSCQFKMSINTETGQVSYLYVTNVVEATTNASWSVNYTNMTMPIGIYYAELYTVDAANDKAISVARGKCNVTKSLFATSDDVISITTTNMSAYLLVSTAEATYLAFADDFTDMTGLGGTTGQVFKADGAGSGTWGDSAGGDSTACDIATTQALHTAELILVAGTNATQTSGIADNLTAINNGAATNATQTSQIVNIISTNATQASGIADLVTAT